MLRAEQPEARCAAARPAKPVLTSQAEKTPAVPAQPDFEALQECAECWGERQPSRACFRRLSRELSQPVPQAWQVSSHPAGLPAQACAPRVEFLPPARLASPSDTGSLLPRARFRTKGKTLASSGQEVTEV